MIQRPPRSTQSRSSAASDVYKRQVFNGVYVTKDVDQGYLDFLDTLRNDDAKAVQRQNEVENLEMHNEG